MEMSKGSCVMWCRRAPPRRLSSPSCQQSRPTRKNMFRSFALLDAFKPIGLNHRTMHCYIYIYIDILIYLYSVTRSSKVCVWWLTFVCFCAGHDRCVRWFGFHRCWPRICSEVAKKQEKSCARPGQSSDSWRGIPVAGQSQNKPSEADSGASRSLAARAAFRQRVVSCLIFLRDLQPITWRTGFAGAQLWMQF